MRLNFFCSTFVSCESLVGAVLIGIHATVAMDLLALSAFYFKLFKMGDLQIVPKYLGRWTFHIFKDRQIVFEDIRNVPPVRHEDLIGLIAHYLIGAFLGILFLVFVERYALQGTKLAIVVGIFYGLLTNILPWFLMYPCMGFGILAKKVRAGTHVLQQSCLNHVVFGAALGFFSNLII